MQQFKVICPQLSVVPDKVWRSLPCYITLQFYEHQSVNIAPTLELIFFFVIKVLENVCLLRICILNLNSFGKDLQAGAKVWKLFLHCTSIVYCRIDYFMLFVLAVEKVWIIKDSV